MEKYMSCLQETILKVQEKLKDQPKLGQMFANCFPNTLETTAKVLDDGSVFVITGDITALWLRDSAAQVKHYLKIAKQNPALGEFIKKLIDKQIFYINIDPYANAFNEEPNGRHYAEDKTAAGPWAWERKYELDSLCYPFELAYLFWKATGRTDHFGKVFHLTLETVLNLWIREQRHEENSAYRFERDTQKRSETLQNGGMGTPVVYTGMTWSGFRPSDDACEYGYLIPSNLFAVKVLQYIMEIAQEIYKDDSLKEKARKLQAEIKAGVEKYGVYEHEVYGKIYAYETDGMGHYVLMDDAGMPSLLSLPYLGCCDVNDEIYQNTRRFALSKDNPYYFEGTKLKGIGSPHTKDGYVWHMGLIMQGMTANTQQEAEEVLRMLAETDANTGFMHEGINCNDPSEFTRPWFAWANSAFSEFVLDYLEKYHGFS